MIRSLKALLCIASLGCVAFSQTPTAATNAPDDKAGAYYNFAMGRLYASMAAEEGAKSEYVTKAIQHYKEALRLNPTSNIIFEELTDIYIQTGRMREAVTQAEDMLKQNPNNLEARRELGRIYVRMVGDPQAGRVSEENLRLATAEFQKITTADPKDADSWVMLGRLYAFSNKSAEAEKAYNSALQADPENEDALTGLAQMYAQQGDTQKAIDKLKSVADKTPNERLLAFLAEQYEQQKDFKNAADALRKAHDAAPDNPRIAAGLARDLVFIGQNDEALALYEELSEDEPNNREYLTAMADIYRIKRDFAKAHATLDKAKATSPRDLELRYQEVKLLEAEGRNADAITALKSMIDETSARASDREARVRAMLVEEYGIVLRQEERYKDAVEAFQQLAQLGGDYNKRGTLQVIDTYRQSNDYVSALREADSAVKKYPDERMFQVERATILAEQGKVDEAATALKAQMKGQPDRDSYVALAQIYEKGKRYTDEGKALDQAEKLSKTPEEQSAIYFMRGAMYERMKNFDASEAAFRKVLELDPDNAGAMNYLGYMLADRNVRLSEAGTLIQKALDLDPENGAYLDSLGWLYFRQGKLMDAENMLVRALDRIGSDPTVHDHLGDVYAKQGKTREAIGQWQMSLAEYKKQPPSQTDTDEVAKVNKKLDDARVRLAQEKK